MLLVLVATPRVVEELPREPGSSGGEEATVAALEKAVEDKYSKLRSWCSHSIPAGMQPAPRVGHSMLPIDGQGDEEGEAPQEQAGVLHVDPSASYIDDVIDEEVDVGIQDDLEDYA